MKFNVNVGKFIGLINPAYKVATKGVIDDFDLSYKITVDANPDGCYISAYGGRMATSLSITDTDYPDVEYQCDTPGISTVNAIDFMNCLNSFPPDTKLVISLDGTEIKIAKANDTEEFQTCPLFDTHIEIPKKFKKANQEIEIVRSVFTQGIEKVGFAIGFEVNKPQYLNYVLEVATGKARFISGSGGRFAVWDVEGKSCVTTKDKCRFFLPKDQTPVLVSILADSNSTDNILISQGEENGKHQIVFKLGTIEVLLVGIENDIKYPDISALIQEKKTYIVTTKAEDWQYATKGLKATWNEEVKKMHNTHESDLVLKIDGNYVLLSSKTNMKASRKVPMTDIREKGEDTLRFHTTTTYISEIYACSEKEDEITLEFVNSNKPGFVRFPKKNLNLDTNANLTLFFASLQG